MMLHLDLDCFFVSAHRTQERSLENIPVAVGGRSNLSIFDRKKAVRKLSSSSGAFVSSILSFEGGKSFGEYFVDPDGRIRGIITTSSYEARAYGVKTAMSVNEALRFCPSLKVLPPDYPLYHELSFKLKTILEKEAPLIEQFSIDEFFIDVSGWIKEENVLKYAQDLKEKVKKELGLPVSIGIAKTKWIAKLATEFAKPFGVKAVWPEEVEDFTKDISIKKFPGIGRGYQERLFGYGIKTLGDIRKRKTLFYSWKKPGIQLYNRVCGTDNEKISVAKSKRSIGIGRTFDPIKEREELERRVVILCRYLSFLVFKSGVNPLTYTIKIKYQYGEKRKSFINHNRMFSETHLKQELLKMFKAIDNLPLQKIIRLNLSVSNFKEEGHTTLNLLAYQEDREQANLTASMQKLREKFGVDIIKSGVEL